MFILNGQIIDTSNIALIDETYYPSGWFSEEAERERVGMIEVAAPTPPSVASNQRALLKEFSQGEGGSWVPVWSILTIPQDEIDSSVQQFETAKKNAITKAYLDCDAVTRLAVGDRTEEYRVAEEEARAYIAAGYTGEVSLSVSSYALYNPTGETQSNQWAADNIVMRADAFRQAQTLMRAKRFEYQAKMRAATNEAELNTAVAQWNAFIAGVRTALGL